MRSISLLLATAALCAVPVFASADWIARQRTLADLSKAADTSLFKRTNTVLTGITTTAALPVAGLRFEGYRSSFGQDFALANDWSQYNVVHLLMTNKEARPLVFKLIVQLRANLDDYTGAFTGEFAIGSNQTRRYTFYLNVDNTEPFGLEYLNPILTAPTTNIVAGTTYRDLRTVYHWRISSQEQNTANVELSDLRLMRHSMDFSYLVDKYGQYTDRTWPNKFWSDSNLVTHKQNELTYLASNPGAGEQSGTLKVSNPMPQPGKWAISTLANGRKFLQHPNGKLFWSLGLNAVHDSLSTAVEGRESFFEALPATTGRFAGCYAYLTTPNGKKLTYSFRKQNLMLKHGDNYLPGWLELTKKRLSSWGVNTVGLDSHKSLLNSSVPFTIALSTTSFGSRLAVSKNIWGSSMPDPYHSTFHSWMVSAFKPTIDLYGASPNFMGAFVDNELSWGTMTTYPYRYNLALGTLVSSSTQPAKVAWVTRLKAKYSVISALNASWKTAFSSWEALAANRTYKPASYSTGMHTDFQTFSKDFATKYFSTVKSALLSAGMTSMYLGCRFADYTNEVATAATGSVDVVTFNMYRFAPDVNWGYFSSLAKPVIISEFGFGMQAFGTFGGPAPVSSPAERAWRMREFMNWAIMHPNIVGVHYYAYADQPITGRASDHENAGIGVVDVGDVPYGDSVKELRAFTATMYSLRAN